MIEEENSSGLGIKRLGILGICQTKRHLTFLKILNWWQSPLKKTYCTVRMSCQFAACKHTCLYALMHDI
jgi:hypothetical protein